MILAVPLEVDRIFIAHPPLANDLDQTGEVPHGLSVDGGDNVSDLQSRHIRGAAGHDPRDPASTFVRFGEHPNPRGVCLRRDKRSGITSDPNRLAGGEYIVRLVGQVVRVSIETVRIVSGLSANQKEWGMSSTADETEITGYPFNS